MHPTIESLTPAQLAAVYNHHTDTPVKKFENREKGARRLLALLAKIEVDPADAIAAVIPSAAQPAGTKALDIVGYLAPTADAHQAAAVPAKAKRQPTLRAKLAARRAEAEAAAPALQTPAGPFGDAPLPDDPDWTPADVGFGDKIEDDARQAAHDAAYQAGYTAGYGEGHGIGFDAGKNAAKTPRAKAAAAPRAASTGTTGNARTLIVAACSRPEGATSAELFETTGWKYASWSHQLKLISAKTGAATEIRKVDGTTRYFVTAR